MFVSMIVSAIHRAAGVVHTAWRRHRAWVELRQLGAGDLKDLGLAPGDAWSAAEADGRGHPFRFNGVFCEPCKG